MQALLETIAHMTALPAEATRLFHGRGGLYPACAPWALDAYPPVFVLTCYAPAEPNEIAQVQAALTQQLAQIAPGVPLDLVFQSRSGRAHTALLCGKVPEPHVVSEAGLRFRVDVCNGQNHGLFLDMAQGRQWVRERCQARPGMRVLNLFAYTCGFSVAALQGGAASVLNLDMSASALSLGQHNHQLNGLGHGARFAAHDLFKSWGKVSRAGPYDLVVVDPPSYQKGSFVASKDYARVIQRLPDLLSPNGQALLCLNAPELDTAFLRQLVATHAPALAFEGRVPNPAAFADATPERSLKVLVFGHHPEQAGGQSGEAGPRT